MVAPAALLRSLGTPVRLAAGDALVRQGDRADHVYLVLSGSARVEIDGAEMGPPVSAGDWVGELAVLDDAPRAATVTATGPVELLAFGAETFTDLLADLPDLRRQITASLTRRLRQVSTGWAQLAVDTDVLLDAYFAIQGAGSDRDRHTAIEQAALLLRRLATATPTETPRVPLGALTPAERRVADLVARGLSNAAVAAELFLSEHTVASHLKHIYVKLEITSRVALAGLVLRSS